VRTSAPCLLGDAKEKAIGQLRVETTHSTLRRSRPFAAIQGSSLSLSGPDIPNRCKSRRRQAVMSRRWLDAHSAAEIGRWTDAIARVRAGRTPLGDVGKLHACDYDIELCVAGEQTESRPGECRGSVDAQLPYPDLAK